MSTSRATNFLGRAANNIYSGVMNASSAMRRGLGSAATNLRYSGWFLKKDWQTFKRTYLSHYLAAFLCVLVAIREWREISMMAGKHKWPDFLGWLVLIITVLTFGAAAIERFANKLSTSAQEIRFQFGVKQLLELLHGLREAKGDSAAIEASFRAFVQRLLDIAAKTFSAKSVVHAGFMLKLPDEDLLQLTQWSGGANYDNKLVVATRPGTKPDEFGPAGLAFSTNQLVYVPKKSREDPKEAWPFQAPNSDTAATEQYSPSDPVCCWKKSTRPEEENFRSVLCVPIEGYGVLSFSTKMRDPFVDRDFFMAEFFASVLRHAEAITRNKKPF